MNNVTFVTNLTLVTFVTFVTGGCDGGMSGYEGYDRLWGTVTGTIIPKALLSLSIKQIVDTKLRRLRRLCSLAVFGGAQGPAETRPWRKFTTAYNHG